MLIGDRNGNRETDTAALGLCGRAPEEPVRQTREEVVGDPWPEIADTKDASSATELAAASTVPPLGV